MVAHEAIVDRLRDRLFAGEAVTLWLCRMLSTHAIICTHTTRHLANTLAGVALQSSRPASVIVSTDNDDPAIVELVRASAAELSCTMHIVQRAHQNESRSSQVRNNAVRELRSLPHSPSDRLWFLDGDCCPAPDALATHESLGKGRSVVIGFRIDLTPEQSEAFSLERLRKGQPPADATPAQWDELRQRHRRYARAAFMRRLGLGKPHKPKLLSANFSVPLADYLAINGFDETYVGYGQEDDDLGRRLYRAGVRAVVGVAKAVVFHQYHPTRAPVAWDKSPNAQRFAQAFDTRCTHGVENPAAQPEPVSYSF